MSIFNISVKRTEKRILKMIFFIVVEKIKLSKRKFDAVCLNKFKDSRRVK